MSSSARRLRLICLFSSFSFLFLFPTRHCLSANWWSAAGQRRKRKTAPRQSPAMMCFVFFFFFYHDQLVKSTHCGEGRRQMCGVYEKATGHCWSVSLTSPEPFRRIWDSLKPHKQSCGSALHLHEAGAFAAYN